MILTKTKKEKVIMSNEKQLVKRSAIEEMSGRLQVSKDVLEKTLKATVCKGTKMQNGQYKPVTNEEFVSFIAVANNYKLNPMIKEIYAYPDTKSAGIIPIVSTDGWNKLMTSHPNYKTHYYRQSEKMVELKGAKPCPEWMEIVIVKKDDSETIIREYLDECFRELKFLNPWQTHTKRMLRHKTKIQGAREAFGFGGIYDQDEGDRIIEAKLVREEPAGKPPVEMPKALTDKDKEPEKKKSGAPEIKTEKEPEPEKEELSKKEIEKQEVGNDGYFDLLAKCRELKKAIGEKAYYATLGTAGYEKSNAMKVPALKEFVKVLEDINAGLKTEDKEERIPGQEG